MRTVYTDGACSGNPGPGGWAWAEVDGSWASGFDPDTTNQRMEVEAVLAALETFDGPVRVVSDSTYVVNCWRDRWWQGWLKRGWKNSQRKPVANRDLWERLVPHFRDRDDLELVWVKGHSGDHWNDVVDRLAVAAVQGRAGSSGDSPPTEADLGDPDAPTGASRSAPEGDPDPAGSAKDGSGRRSDAARSRDGRVPDGFLVVVTGSDGAGSAEVDQLARVLGGWAEMHPDALVLTGLREGAEAVAVEAARRAGVEWSAILPYPDPELAWSAPKRRRFARDRDDARSVVVLEKTRPVDADGRRKALARRDGWLRSVADQVVFVMVPGDGAAEESLSKWTRALGDDLWLLEVPAGRR